MQSAKDYIEKAEEQLITKKKKSKSNRKVKIKIEILKLETLPYIASCSWTSSFDYDSHYHYVGEEKPSGLNIFLIIRFQQLNKNYFAIA